MSGSLRLSEAATLALHAAAFLAASPAGRASSREMAEAMSVSEAHLAKVLNRLAKARILDSTRGPTGGFSLTRSPRKVRLLDVYEAIEGPIQASTCLLGRPVCGKSTCPLGGMMHEVNTRVRAWLSSTRLSDPDLAFQPLAMR